MLSNTLEKKQQLLEQSLVTQEQHYGADHFEVAITLESLGNAYGNLGRKTVSSGYVENLATIFGFPDFFS